MELGGSGLTLLEHVYNRLNKSKYIDKVVFAIPESKQNDELATFLSDKNIEFYRGSEDDVLSRFYECAIKYQPKFVVRATCDNPLVDWELIDYLFDQFGNADYISTDDTPLGTSAELFTMESLSEANKNAMYDEEREHVTPYIIRQKKSVLTSYNGLSYRLTVDEERDIEMMNKIYSHLYQDAPIPNKEVYKYLNQHPEVAEYNKSVHQKELGE